MYLEHFGLNEPPFRITPVTEFFFSGANRGEILDALIYSICEVEGIVKVSGEVGSGKTMLCRMLLEKLPGHIETIYLANPSLSREEMLYAIADGLGLNINGERVGIIMQNIQNRLEEKAREGKRIVVLVDEAHAMPPDTLEELRLLYNLQVGNAKLLQLVLFGQPELNAKLDQPNMRQLKDRIVHHFNMQPLSRSIIESYLMFRMRAANYHGPNIFSPNAIKLIANASNGLMRRVNVLADKSLLAAFVEDTHNIEARHVQAAMRDSELKPARPPLDRKLLAGSAVAALVVTGLAVWWMLDKPQTPLRQAASTRPLALNSAEGSGQATSPFATSGDSGQAQDSPPAQPSFPPDHLPETPTATPQPIAAQPDNAHVPATGATGQAAATPAAPARVTPKTDNPPAQTSTGKPATGSTSLFDQRMEAGKQLLEQKQAAASIQLFYSEQINVRRIENFLVRADGLGKLSEIYLLPAKFGSKDGLRVLYGAYPTADAARSDIQNLPKRYQDAFATSIYIF
ncbi:MAG: AAA family ATPase [Gallionella sp.]|nr:AAA family ATPase [Gallionella sp.]